MLTYADVSNVMALSLLHDSAILEIRDLIGLHCQYAARFRVGNARFWLVERGSSSSLSFMAIAWTTGFLRLRAGGRHFVFFVVAQRSKRIQKPRPETRRDRNDCHSLF